jgi:hypothetical protein
MLCVDCEICKIFLRTIDQHIYTWQKNMLGWATPWLPPTGCEGAAHAILTRKQKSWRWPPTYAGDCHVAGDTSQNFPRQGSGQICEDMWITHTPHCVI